MPPQRTEQVMRIPTVWRIVGEEHSHRHQNISGGTSLLHQFKLTGTFIHQLVPYRNQDFLTVTAIHSLKRSNTPQSDLTVGTVYLHY